MILEKNGQHVLAHADWFSFTIKPNNVYMEKELGNEDQEETYNFDSETEKGMENSDNEQLEETDKENELRPRSPI